MRHSASLFRFEITRLLLSRRWIVVVAVAFGTAYLAASSASGFAFNAGVTTSAWDVHAVSLNSALYVGYLLLTAYALLVGDSLVLDRATGYAALILARAEDRRRWWRARVVVLIVAALLVQMLFLAMCLGLGWLQGKSLDAAPSEFAQAHAGTGDVLAQPFFTPVEPGANMAARQLVLAAYLSLAFAAVGCVLVAASIRWAKTHLVVACTFAIVIVDSLINWLVYADWYNHLSPVLRLMEGAHSAALVDNPLSWTSSVVYFTALLVTGFVLGERLIVKADL